MGGAQFEGTGSQPRLWLGITHLQVEPHPSALGPVLRVDVVRVLDEVPASLAVPPVIPAVGLEGVAEPPLHVVVPTDDVAGPVEDGVGAHLRRDELLPDVVRADGREAEGAAPESELRARDHLLAGREHDLRRVAVGRRRLRCFLFFAGSAARQHPRAVGRSVSRPVSRSRYAVMSAAQGWICRRPWRLQNRRRR